MDQQFGEGPPLALSVREIFLGLGLVHFARFEDFLAVQALQELAVVVLRDHLDVDVVTRLIHELAFFTRNFGKLKS